MFHSLVDNVDFENLNGSYPQLNRMRFLTSGTNSLGNGNCSNFRKLSNYDVRRFDECNQTSFNADQLIFTLFDALKNPETDKIDPVEVIEMIMRAGIEISDPRIAQFISNVSVSAGIFRDSHGTWSPKSRKKISSIFLDREMFAQAASCNLQMLIKIATNDFCVPQFNNFQAIIRELFELCESNMEGNNASYIPQLADVDSSKWAVSVCTIDGQKYNLGDYDQLFTLQSTTKPLTYALAITEHGPDKVHDYVGYEPSGRKFNLVILNDQNKPHNPLINSGAIAVTALLKNGSSMPERFTYINKELSRMAGGVNLGFNNPVYLSERSSADRNFSLAYYMREHKCFPPGTDLHETLDLYFQICSIEADTKSMATIAATLANGGVNPITGERILSGPAVRDTLSVMHSCGMYDYSGQFAFKVGLPAKSGVSGAIMLVVPNLMGIAIYSPRLDEQGNSVRGIQFCQELVKRFVFHNYDSLLHSGAKLDPRKQMNEERVQSVVRLLFAAKNNDLSELRRCLIANVDFNTTDYDDRTGLHVAASAGAFDAVRFFIEVARVHPNPLDRWSRTPYIDAKHFGHQQICEYLQRHIKKGEVSAFTDEKNSPRFQSFDADAAKSPKKSHFSKQQKTEEFDIIKSMDASVPEQFEHNCVIHE